MRWVWVPVLLMPMVGCATSRERSGPAEAVPARQSPGSSGAGPASSPYVQRTAQGYLVGFPGKSEGAVVVQKEEMASLLGLPSPHPEARMSESIFKELLRRIKAWTQEHGAEWLCLTTLLVRWKCNKEVDGAFASSKEAAAYRNRFDFYTGGGEASEAALKRNMEACGRASFVNPLVLCTVDWKRMDRATSVCVAYAICVAGYSFVLGKASEAAARQGE